MMGTHGMATLRMASLWQNPRTGVWKLRKRIPTRYRAVAGQRGETVKISTGTADRKAAAREMPRVLSEWAKMEAEWERRLNVVALTPDAAREVAAKWAAWITADPGRLELAEGDRGLFASRVDGELSGALTAVMTAMKARGVGRTPDEAEAEAAAKVAAETAARQARESQLLQVHAEEAAEVSGIVVSAETHGALLSALRPIVAAAYREAALRDMGATGTGARWNPLQAARKALPPVPDPPPPSRPGQTFDALWEAWKTVAVAKPRTIAETKYCLGQLAAFLGHDDAAKVTREDMRRWRDTTKAETLTNNTWNNRLSLIRQVFTHAVADGHLTENPADNSLRLRKNKPVVPRLPFSDDEAARILLATRKETKPTRRWAHWIMAFTGMRVGEVLQLTRGDVRQEGGIWFLDIHEDDPGKSVKTGRPRHVPIHPALIAEGLIAYVQGLPSDGPLFPDKGLDVHGQRGGRGWNAVGTWVRKTVGITDINKPPDHAWRHRLEDELRAAEVPEDARDAIVGHSRKTTGRVYGVRGEALARLHRELAKVPVPPGVAMG